MYRILVVDDETTTVSVLNHVLKRWGYEVVPAFRGDEALRIFKSGAFDLILTDIRMAPMTGVELLQKVREQDPDIPVIMLSGYQDISTVAKAMEAGAFDYLEKPFEIRDIVATMNRALAYRQALRGILDLGLVAGSCHRLGDIVAESPSMREVCAGIRQLAAAETAILIAGEKGTGRSLVARTIHETGQRKGKPFVTVDCASLGKGSALPEWKKLLESAGDGAVFLREAHGLPAGEQEKLCETIRRMRESAGDKDGRAAVPRILASADPAMGRDSAVFVPNLASELSLVRIEIEPLRRRQADILPLAYHMLCRELGNAGAVPPMDMDVSLILERYDWPGNVAELETMIRGILAQGKPDRIHGNLLPKTITEKAGHVSSVGDLDLKNEFLFGQGLKRFISGKGKEQVERLVESIRRLHRSVKRP